MIAPDDPLAEDVGRVLAAHLELMHHETPLEDVHALDAGQLADPSVSFFSYRRGGELLAVGALRAVDGEPGHGELKSMHTRAAARGQGIGAAMVAHLVGVARARAWHRLSLETGTGPAFEPAQRLYARCGFIACEPFADYQLSPNSFFMTLDLDEGNGSVSAG
ncbi:MAG: GNAT family N-acetyltransferase [Acidimicrobiales bacterium]